MVALATGMAIAGGAAKAAGAVDSIISQRRLERQLKDLNKTPMARFQVDSKIEDLYRQSVGEASNPRGFSGANYSGFRKNLGSVQRGRFANAISASGGQGSRAINAVLVGQELDSLGNYFTADENIRRGNRQSALSRSGTYANVFQNIRNQNTSNDINYRMQLERGLGDGIRSQKDYRRGMLSSMGGDLLTAGIMKGFGGGEEVDDNGNAMEQPAYSPKLSYGNLSSGINRDLVARRGRSRNLGAYNSQNFDFGSYDDGSPVRIR